MEDARSEAQALGVVGRVEDLALDLRVSVSCARVLDGLGKTHPHEVQYALAWDGHGVQG